ncbi:uncharacterized membrane protein YjfL (UPF0719 family) [Kineococcus xinjiangensis]|uniref:Uncharacterized membrane protein YjfL (UPF0719 family) n=1 Tax=Kineococcus xinjiangensis TaxID=512762 RepID=A0A2S6IM54_9ACTN|nr:DUF350 domain-containing protein [Kineococcus xinjiangensis]PPK95261.1 uncharacterized membrane protein YjfL (UPF0719 family) [Kineococcus xinjiangensis]
MIEDLFEGTVASVAYLAVGLVLMAIGYVVIDLLTPGKLGDLIWTHRNANAALVLCSGLLSVATVIVTAIMTSENDLADGLLSTAVYGGLGLLMLAVTFFVVDMATPGKLGDTLISDRLHPAAWVTAVAHLSGGAIVAASIS